MTKVGFIGLGEQGKPLAINVAKGGLDLMVYDLRPEPVEELSLALELGGELEMELPAAALTRRMIVQMLGERGEKARDSTGLRIDRSRRI
ncbi:MAG TPA: NAD(P)-binding domain-containing protein [Candidatus Binataceae bacterium]|jgi:3-hydroxyisobutyrate dehydrogenase-like beta-hydroxyacid dehydrogenase|nr:NAD(P)-binding domain-containing protein [Candidatus Binataceae bacterium]